MRLLRLAAAGLLLAGCGAGSPAAGGDVPVTARSLAVVVAERTDEPSSGEEPLSDERRPREIAAADLRYGTTGESDGALVRVSVSGVPVAEPLQCDADEALHVYDGCATTDRGELLWMLEEPEEDFGAVTVVVRKGDVYAVVLAAGERITKDPRQLDLSLSVEEMFNIANDPRVDETTSQEAVDTDPPWWVEPGSPRTRSPGP